MRKPSSLLGERRKGRTLLSFIMRGAHESYVIAGNGTTWFIWTSERLRPCKSVLCRTKMIYINPIASWINISLSRENTVNHPPFVWHISTLIGRATVAHKLFIKRKYDFINNSLSVLAHLFVFDEQSDVTNFYHINNARTARFNQCVIYQ